MGTRSLAVGDFSHAVASVLTELADRAGVSQYALARETGISQSRVNLIMRAKRAITVEETAMICDALGVSMVMVIRDAENRSIASADNVVPLRAEPLPDATIEHVELTAEQQAMLAAAKTSKTIKERTKKRAEDPGTDPPQA